MKKISFIAFFIILISPIFSFAQWEWLNPKPSGYNGLRIVFTDTVRGFILQADGALLITEDQGENWNVKQRFPIPTPSMDIKDSLGVIVSSSSGYIYVSNDLGNNWAPVYTGITGANMLDIVSRDTIFLGNNNGKIYRSDDRGLTWKSFNCNRQIGSMDFVNSKVGYAGGTSNVILKTEDGGATWQTKLNVNTFPSNCLSMTFLDINSGFVFREHSTILSTKDGGTTWSEYNIGDDIYSLQFINSTTGFAVGEYGASYRTDDGGKTWKWIGMTARIDYYHLYSVCFLTAKTGFTVGARGRILKTTDGGNSWTTYSPHYLNVSDISAPTRATLYSTVGNSIYKTTDSGKVWKELALRVGTNYAEYDQFQTCHFFNADTGIVTASENARLYKTYDGGTNWKLINLTTYYYDNVTDIQFLNYKTGFLAVNNSSNSLIIKTKDAGETWAPAWSAQYMGEYFRKIFFIDEKTGYAGRYNQLYKTEDSAKTWTKLWEKENINTISFTNAANGLVAGDNGLLMQTTDSGKTWKPITISSQYYDDIYKIKFFSEQIGYLSAENGSLYKTIDGGKTWNLNFRSTGRIDGIKFGSDSSIYLTGYNGAILRSDEIGGYAFDSLTVKTTDNCNFVFSGVVSSVIKSADSIRFEFGYFNSFTNSIAVSPDRVENSQISISASVGNLIPGFPYSVRIKLFFNGQYYYSNPYSFTTASRPSKPSITPSVNSNICTGDSLKLTSSANTGIQWILNGQVIPGANQPTYYARMQGKYQLIKTDGCLISDTASIIITEIAAPAKPTITLTDLVLYSSSSTGNQWYANDTAINGAFDQSYKPTASGKYTLKVKVNNCYSQFSEPISVVITGINSPYLESKLQLGPNPAQDQLYVKYSGNPAPMSLKLTDVLGKIVYQQTFNGSLTVDMRKFWAGVYIVEVKNLRTKEQVIKKIVRN